MMDKCPYKEYCDYYRANFSNMPEKYAQILEIYYCYGNQCECARYLIAHALGVEELPADLAPYCMDSAKKILDKKVFI
ncbi:hypothetical protein [Anaeromicrobium sediminis]|uniref:Uncharacterized protein n=1 Tax=Anaeromicrobium sediminis TaxID=1478221 RepID=A0A267MGJ3_9FIRM|nr:hypothetical protein [Anaeromicrobium sediminis]PAB58522.1 hypothetical protein CCE28_14545 [Anaeromicrobium sediminis]